MIYAVCILYIIASVLILSFSTSYAILTGDDLGIRQPPEPLTFTGVLRVAADKVAYAYHAWQGTFFMIFLNTVLHPMNGLGMTGFRITMFTCTILFFLSLFFFIVVLNRFIRNDKHRHVIPFIALFLFAFLNLHPDSYSEVFFNLTTATNYSVPMALSFLSLSLMLKAFRGPDMRGIVIACIASFCVSGCSLMTVGAHCYLLLLLTVYAYLKHRPVFRYCLANLAVSLAGALVNVLAPGNYERQRAIGGATGGFVSAALSTVKYTLLETEALLSGTPFLASLIAMLILSMLVRDTDEPGRILTCIRLSAFTLVTPFVALFPLELGSHSAGLHPRGQFVLDVYLFLSLAHIVFFLGQYIKCRMPDATRNALLSVLFLNALMALSFNDMTILSSPQWGMTRNLLGGFYRRYHADMQTVMYELENSTEPDLVLTLPEDLDQYLNCSISADPDDPVNHGLAVIYEKNSIRAVKRHQP